MKVAVKTATKIATEKKITTKQRYLTLPQKKGKDEGGRPVYPGGTVVFRMGKTKRGAEYKAMLPPYDQPKLVSSKLPPVGMKRTEGTPSETLTVIGGKKLPFGHISADIGVVDAFVDIGRRKIRFAPGLRTNVGQRIPSNTRGVSLANNQMRVTRQGQIYYTQLKGSKGVAISRYNPRRRRGRRV
jgi:hypothetical protein